MNFFKKFLGVQPNLDERIKNFKAKGTLFEVLKTKRNLMLIDCMINFKKQGPFKYVIEFSKDASNFELPIHLDMHPVVFKIQPKGKQQACFQWQTPQDRDHVGCHMDPESKNEFKQILCLTLKEIAKDENIKDHLSFCQQLAGVPVYKPKDNKSHSQISKSVASESRAQLNEILINEANKQQNKMVHTCSVSYIQFKEKKLIQQNAIFVVKSYPNFQYQFQLINATGFAFLKFPIDSGLNYEINQDYGYIRWIDFSNDCRIIQANFQGKKDAALSLKYNMLEVMYELRQKKRFDESYEPQQIAYMKNVSEEVPMEEVFKTKIIKLYENQPEIQEIGKKEFLFKDEELKKGEKYDIFYQAKNHDFSIVALGSLLQNLSISEQSEITSRDKRRLFDKQGRQVDIEDILLHDRDRKGFIKGKDGKIYNQDFEKGKLIEEYCPSPKKGIINICPASKLAETQEFATFKAISANAIYEMDPRIKDGVGSMKEYSGNPQFKNISATGDGSFVTGSANGEIRFYNKQVGKNANNKFTSVGEPVIHLDTTKDGQWVLATFSNYLRLIPTETNDGNLFNKKIPYEHRMRPIKLQLCLEDIQSFGVKEFRFIPAKFDETKDGKEKFIISGFGQYTIIWNLSKAVTGDKSYLISKTDGQVQQADFRFNNPTQIVMTTSNGIVVKENKFRK